MDGSARAGARVGIHGWWRGFFVLGLLVVAVAQAAPVVVNEETRKLSLADAAEYWRDASAAVTFERAREIAGEGGFLAQGASRPSFGYTADAIWLRVQVRSEMKSDSRWLLELMTARLDEVDWHVVNADGRTWHQAEGNLRPKNAAAHDFRYPSVEVGLAPGETVTVYLRVYSETAINLPLRLWQPEGYVAHSNRLEWAKGIFFGYLVSLLLFGAAFAVVTRERAFVFFLVVVATLLITFLAQGGYPLWLEWPQARLLTRQGMLCSMLLALSGTGLCLLRFFGISVATHPWLYRLLMASIWAPVGALFWAWAGSLRGALEITSVLQLATALLLIWVTIHFRNKQVKGYRLFALCWSTTMFLHGVIMLQLRGVLPMWMEWELAFQVVICFGATCFLGVLGEQVREIRLEREQARESALALERDATQRLEREVRERTEDLRVEKEKAEEANRFKSLFLANISHEIRAPLSTLTGLSQAMWLQASELNLPPDFATALRQVRMGGEYLNLILINLLDVSAAEAGRMPMHWQLIDPSEWAVSVRNLLDPIATSQRVELRWEVALATEDRVETDVVRLTQILLNVAHNALKFTPAGGLVTVRIRQTAEKLEIEVADEGPGIPEQYRVAVFEPFRQAEARERGPLRGVGLGLSVVRLNADLLGAWVKISNREQGGALIEIHLPVRRVPREL